ncbi:flagellar export protein FliJ [Cohnella sp. CFH 77786]|uniref:flagellar export protein FliJ n=1 Tax=Cohnella sp. CFH 77786 TaxID=2662265 RepID=UPI001C6086B6|nr:flagellar export protein FliJ [Cohnella sp. CFH 77786]MBW5444574.1 flagellar export protein FliJ [Cohnella sp. CFH 77786]
MRFRYPLQKIVDLKGSEKSMAEWEYAASLGRLKEEEERLRELDAERAAARERIESSAASGVTLAELTSLQHYLDVLDGKVRRQTEGVEAAEALVRLRRSKLAEKSIDEKVWQNARDKALRIHRHEWLIKQQNELDEIATVRAASARG